MCVVYVRSACAFNIDSYMDSRFDMAAAMSSVTSQWAINRKFNISQNVWCINYQTQHKSFSYDHIYIICANVQLITFVNKFNRFEKQLVICISLVSVGRNNHLLNLRGSGGPLVEISIVTWNLSQTIRVLGLILFDNDYGVYIRTCKNFQGSKSRSLKVWRQNIFLKRTLTRYRKLV